MPWTMLHLPIFLRGVVAALRLPFARISRGSRRSSQSAGPLPEKPARRYAPTKIWPDSPHSKGLGAQ
jgi:hypothetical protein